jgi:hypothetical protein
MKTKSDRKKRKLIIAGGLLVATMVLASAFLVGSGAIFTATSANPGNVFTAGSLLINNSKEGAAIVTANVGNMKPGDTATGDVTIENAGTISGDFALAMGVPAGALTPTLRLVVTDLDSSTTIYSGALSAFPGANLGSWAASAVHHYRFAVTFVSSGADNTYMGASSTVSFNWTATQN